jgi:hypothetical protein
MMGLLAAVRGSEFGTPRRIAAVKGSDAIGAKRTCRERRKRVDLTKMTHKRHCAAKFAVMHKGLSRRM